MQTLERKNFKTLSFLKRLKIKAKYLMQIFQP